MRKKLVFNLVVLGLLLRIALAAKDDLSVYVVSRDVGDVGSGKYTRHYDNPTRIFFEDGKDRVIKSIDSGIGYSLALTQDGQLYGVGSNFYHQISHRNVNGFSKWTLVDRGPKKVSVFQVYRHFVAAVDAENDDIHLWSSNPMDDKVYHFGKDSLIKEERKKGFKVKEIALCSNRILLLYCPPKDTSLEDEHCSMYFYFLLIEDNVHSFVGPQKFVYHFAHSRIDHILATDSTTLLIKKDKSFHLILYPTYTFGTIDDVLNFDAGAEKSYVYKLETFGNETKPILMIIEDSQLGKETRQQKYFLKEKLSSIRCNSHGMVALNYEGSNEIHLFGNNEFAFFSETGERELLFPRTSNYLIPVEFGDKISSLSTGKFHFMVLTEKNKVYSIGLNVSGVLGMDTKDENNWNPRRPFKIPIELSSTKIKKIIGNRQTSVILYEDKKTVISIGGNIKSQLCSDNFDLQSREIGDDLRRKVPNLGERMEIQDISIGDDFLVFIVNGSLYHCGELPFEIGSRTDEKEKIWERISCGDRHCVRVSSKKEAYTLIPGMILDILMVDVKYMSSIANRTILLTESNQVAYMTAISRFPEEREGSLYLLVPPDLSKNEHFVKVNAGGEFSLLLTNKGRLFKVAFSHGYVPMKPEQVVVSKPNQGIYSFSTSGNLAVIAYSSSGKNRIQSIDFQYPSIYQDDNMDRSDFSLRGQWVLIKLFFEILGSRSAVRRAWEYDKYPHNSLNFVIDGYCNEVFTSGERLLMLCRQPPIVKKLDHETMSRDKKFFIVTGVMWLILFFYVSCCCLGIYTREMLFKLKKRWERKRRIRNTHHGKID